MRPHLARPLGTLLVALFGLIGWHWPAESATAATGDSSSYALLVGCTRYDNNHIFRLVGPGNDVELMQRVLQKKFAFPPDHIVMLSEKVGGNFRPTYANIAREFAVLAQKAKPHDQIVILLGGHGSQQPEQDPPDTKYPKPDGRDQIFLPCDVGKYDFVKTHKVANVIPDYELRRWCKTITATGASLWLIVDSCCSGSTLRGGDEVSRKVEPEDLGIPDKEFDKALDRAAKRGGTRGRLDATELRFQVDDQSPNFFGIYAAMPDEPTIERPLPIDAANAESHGLLTYTICETLERLRAAEYLTYTELYKLICHAYTQMGRTGGPHPIIEGSESYHTVVLGPVLRGDSRDADSLKGLLGASVGGASVGRSRFSLVKDRTGWRVDAGQLQGLTAGTVLAVYPPPNQENADTLIGHVKISNVSTLDAAILPCEYAGKPAPAESTLVLGARCEPVYIDLGDMRLKVAVDVNDKTPADAKSRLGQIEAELRALAAKPGCLFTVVAGNKSPNWVVQWRDGEAVLLSADAAEIAGQLPLRVPRFPLPEKDAANALAEYTTRIFRAQNLLRLTSPGVFINHPSRGPKGLSNDGSAIDVEVQMLKLQNENDTKGTPISADGTAAGGELTIPPGQWVGWQITNHSRFAVDVTLLFVDSEFGIAAAFPRPGSGVDNSIPAGGHIFAVAAQTTPTKYNLDQMVTIAVKSTGQAIDFSVLEQSNIAAVHSAMRGAGDPTMDSPLGELFQNALYGTGGTRGLSMKLSTHKLDLMSWRVSNDTADAKKQ